MQIRHNDRVDKINKNSLFKLQMSRKPMQHHEKELERNKLQCKNEVCFKTC